MKARLQSFFDYLADECIVQEHNYGDLPHVEDLAVRLSQSFLVETRLALISQGEVGIQAVGTLKSDSKNIFFSPSPQLIDDLQHRTPKLDDYLKGVTGESFSVQTPFRGLPLLPRVGAWLLERLLSKDPGLRKLVKENGEEGATALLLPALEFAIHDAICLGEPFVEMDSVGIFVPNESGQTVDFRPDAHLLAGLAAAAAREQNQNRGKWGFGPSVGEIQREEEGTGKNTWKEFLPEEKEILDAIPEDLRAAVSRGAKA